MNATVTRRAQRRRDTAHRRRTAVVALSAGTLTTALTWCAATAFEPTATPVTTQPDFSVSSPSMTPSPVKTMRTKTPVPTTAPTAKEPQLLIEAINAAMPLKAVGVTASGAMAVPTHPSAAGLYQFGAQPGAAEGASVVAAHVDDRDHGVGPFASLGTLNLGNTVQITWDGQVHMYAVEQVQRVSKNALDTAALFDGSGPHRLHLVTCGGPFNSRTQHYRDNLIVTASPVR